MKILIAGSNGMIGGALYEHLAGNGHEMFRLVRHAAAADNEIGWNPDPDNGSVDTRAMEAFDAIINLGGISIGEKRWTDKQKAVLWNTRVASTEILSRAIATLSYPPKVFVSASAIGIYGDRGDTLLTESAKPGKSGFLVDLCRHWEQATAALDETGVRVAHIRSGVVLARGQGVLKEQEKLFNLCLGGRIGSGRQFISWISLVDEVRAITHILQDHALSGALNMVSPHAVTNDHYTQALAAVIGRPAKIPTPRWMVAAALGGEFADQVLLASQNVHPERLLDSGFRFEDTDLLSTLDRIFAPEDVDDAGDPSDLDPNDDSR